MKKPTRLKSLRANQCSVKSFFSAFSTKRKLIDDSFEHSGSHLCLKTVHLALHWEATQQKSPQYPFSFPGKQKLPYDKLTIFTRSRKKHRQQLVLVFRRLHWKYRAYSSCWRCSFKYINRDFWNCFELFLLLRLSCVDPRSYASIWREGMHEGAIMVSVHSLTQDSRML